MLIPKIEERTRREMQEHLLSLPFDRFAACIALLLERVGYEDVRPAGRSTGAKKSQSVGYDLTALLPGMAPGSGRRVIIQLKQYHKGVWLYQRQVDELRGKCLRVGASEALLITTGALSYSIRRSQMQNAPLAPVRLIDGEELLDLLLANRMKVVPQKQGSSNETAVEQNKGNHVGNCGGANKPPASVMPPSSANGPKVSVTIFLTATGGEESNRNKDARSR